MTLFWITKSRTFNSFMKHCCVGYVPKRLFLMHLYWNYNVCKGWNLNPAKHADSLLKEAPFIAAGKTHLKYLSGLSGWMHSAPTCTTCTPNHSPSAGSIRTDIQHKCTENRKCSSPPGQKTSLTQETELLESLLQEVEHQVGCVQQLKSTTELRVFVSGVKLWQACPNCGFFLRT